jgi:hypothetical protein
LRSERAQHQIELGLELRDSSELDAQFPFSIGKPLGDGPERFRGGAAPKRPSSRMGWRRSQSISLHGELLRFP